MGGGRCKVNAGHVAILQACAVVLGIIGILLVADATFEDGKLDRYLDKHVVWERLNSSVHLDKAKWIGRERDYKRGKLDWFFLSCLILLTLTHIFLVLNLMHEISLARRKEDVSVNRRGLSAVTTTINILASDTNAGTCIVTAPAAPATSDSTILLAASPAEEKQNNVASAVPDPISVDRIKLRLKRREQYAKLFAASATVIAFLSVLLTSGIGFEVYLVKQLDEFYQREGKKTHVTDPFPRICAMKHREILRTYISEGQNDPYSQGICNSYVLKLTGSAVAILIVLISLIVSVLYALRYRKMMKTRRGTNDENLEPAQLSSNQAGPTATGKTAGVIDNSNGNAES